MDIEFPRKLHFLLTKSARYKVLYGGRGAGKCLALGTRVIMFDGSIKAVEDIIVGDQLMGPDNKPRDVLGTCRGFDDMYKVKQTSGIDYVVNSAHILSLKKSNVSIREGRYNNYSNICNINIVEAMNNSKRWKDHFRGYRAGLINFSTKDVKINPWYLGAWLGDGKANDSIIYSMDKEVLEACSKYADELNMRISIYDQPNNKSKGISIRKIIGNGDGKFNPLWDKFIHYNLFNNKHIPNDYLTNSEEIRLQLLAGLLDSDGSLNNNGYEICQTNEKLIKDIKYLADGLGFRTNFTLRETICGNNGVRGLAYRLTIGGDTWRIPCKIVRKIVKKEDVRKNKDFLLSQIEIEPVGRGEYAGFSLNGDKLFLLEDGTVTHNTENIARALIMLCLSKRLRIACFREFQNSIGDSVKSTLESQIIDMNLSDRFEIQDKKIICLQTGSEFIFFGLRYNINTIKSLSRIDIAWVEEAINVSKTSWEKLGPTIRGRHEEDPNGMGGPFGKGPEIWVSFNPELDTDETYKRFVIQRDKYAPEFWTDPRTGIKEAYAVVEKVNWSDNKWFPTDLYKDMVISKENNQDEWLNVWEGHTKQVLDGAIYAQEIKKTLLENRRTKVIYNSSKPVNVFCDIGFSDYFTMWFVQHAGVEFNIINYYQNRLQKIPHYVEILKEYGYIYGSIYLPHDGDAETASNRTPRKQFEDHGFKVKITQRPAKKMFGIQAARAVFDLCNFDEENTSEGWQCLTRYKYKVDKDGKFSREPDHDVYSHGADGFQTFALSLKGEQDIKKKKPTNSEKVVPISRYSSNSGWMGS